MDPDYDAEEVVEVIEIDDNEHISDDDAGDEGLNLHFRKKRNPQMSYSYERQNMSFSAVRCYCCQS